MFNEKFNLDKAINSEDYAMNIEFKLKFYSNIHNRERIIDICYDDIIYTMSIIYGSSINIYEFFKVFNEKEENLPNLLYSIEMYHCMNFDKAIIEVINDVFYDRNINYNIEKFKQSR